MDKKEGLNNTLLLKITEVWLGRYCNQPGMQPAEFIKHKKNLYAFFKEFTENVQDYNVWRLIARIRQMLQEPIDQIKEAKMNEIRALQKINWHVEIETCELVERAVCELMKILEAHGMSNEERAFVKTTAMTIEDTLKRKFKIQDIVERMSQ